ncbi:23S ribosomal RNA methyltransferase Erm [Microbacterium sp. TNHR37B]|uniref:23S ribosomal RNA methyltransferase Erm n=1 Tax=Microbacterium sp. TNHR37B TaxID=1775956 RepID=UPI0007B29ED2|nr:23S ribosomal RNA methyltransferase Erm [Microbacterium sp. TNHR37B]KZE89880.1 rRNA methyltransferase [Microbacterium sp. TNHR37B]
MPRSHHGGRHELGQNFLIHDPSIDAVVRLVAETHGPILELGAGDGALTRPLAAQGRPLTAIDLDEHRVRRLAERLPRVDVVHADALTFPLRAPVIVGNIPFHVTTPILRRLLREPAWERAILLTQWEVARKRAGVGGRTMMTAQHAPWFAFALHGRVPRWGFSPPPSVDGGILGISRRAAPLLPDAQRGAYQDFVRSVFSGRGGRLERVVQGAARVGPSVAQRAVARAQAQGALPRDLSPEQWVTIWQALRR